MSDLEKNHQFVKPVKCECYSLILRGSEVNGTEAPPSVGIITCLSSYIYTFIISKVHNGLCMYAQ